jgi:hypothetical protein
MEGVRREQPKYGKFAHFYELAVIDISTGANEEISGWPEKRMSFCGYVQQLGIARGFSVIWHLRWVWHGGCTGLATVLFL